MKLIKKHVINAHNELLLLMRTLGLITQEDVCNITRTVATAKNREEKKPLIQKLDDIDIKQGFNGIKLENNE